MTTAISKRREQKSSYQRRRYRNRTPQQIERDKETRRARKDKENARNRKYYEAHRDQINKIRRERYGSLTIEQRDRLKKAQRRWLLHREYGISQEQFDDLLRKQKNKCAICGDSENGGRMWHVDHCHNSGEIRGILCGRCNKMLGLARDRQSILRRAARYLDDFSRKGEPLTYAPKNR